MLAWCPLVLAVAGAGLRVRSASRRFCRTLWRWCPTTARMTFTVGAGDVDRRCSGVSWIFFGYWEAFDNAQWSRMTFRWARLVPQERIRGAQWRSSTLRWAGLVPQERIRCAQCRSSTFRWAGLVPQGRIRHAQCRSSTFRWAGLVPQERIRGAQWRRLLVVWLASGDWEEHLSVKLYSVDCQFGLRALSFVPRCAPQAAFSS